MFELRPPPKLYIVKQVGCGACAEAEPHIAAFARKYVGRIFVIPSYGRSVLDWSPSATPAYALVDGGRIVKKHVGGMTLTEMERWIFKTPADEADDDEQEN